MLLTDYPTIIVIPYVLLAKCWSIFKQTNYNFALPAYHPQKKFSHNCLIVQSIFRGGMFGIVPCLRWACLYLIKQKIGLKMEMGWVFSILEHAIMHIQ